MTPDAWATVVLAIVAVATVIGGLTAYFYRRGDKEGRFEAAMDRNTTAVDRLSDRLTLVTDTLHEHATTLVAHDYRIRNVEAHIGSEPAVRDSGSAGGH
jgi:hypothetical protein